MSTQSNCLYTFIFKFLSVIWRYDGCCVVDDNGTRHKLYGSFFQHRDL